LVIRMLRRLRPREGRFQGAGRRMRPGVESRTKRKGTATARHGETAAKRPHRFGSHQCDSARDQHKGRGRRQRARLYPRSTSGPRLSCRPSRTASGHCICFPPYFSKLVAFSRETRWGYGLPVFFSFSPCGDHFVFDRGTLPRDVFFVPSVHAPRASSAYPLVHFSFWCLRLWDFTVVLPKRDGLGPLRRSPSLASRVPFLSKALFHSFAYRVTFFSEAWPGHPRPSTAADPDRAPRLPVRATHT